MLKEQDKKIISHLRKNARITLTNMSKRIGVPVSTIFERIKRHEKSIIRKHTALLDFTQLGYTTIANITIKVDKSIKAEIADFLMKHHSVNSVYKITNGYDFLVEGIFKNLLDLENFNEQLEEKFKIKQKQVYFIIDDIKREGFMGEPELVDLLG